MIIRSVSWFVSKMIVYRDHYWVSGILIVVVVVVVVVMMMFDPMGIMTVVVIVVMTVIVVDWLEMNSMFRHADPSPVTIIIPTIACQ